MILLPLFPGLSACKVKVKVNARKGPPAQPDNLFSIPWRSTPREADRFNYKYPMSFFTVEFNRKGQFR